MESTAKCPIKFSLQGSSRRRARLDVPLRMAQMRKVLKSSFPELREQAFSVRYVDEEGDEIEVMSNAELEEARQVFDALGRVMSFSVVLAADDEELPPAGPCRGRRWHKLAHMLGMNPADMEPQMQQMLRFGMLKHFVHMRKSGKQKKHTGKPERTDLQCTFIDDTTVPDGTTMAPLQRFEKKWQVKTGDKAWPAGCFLEHVGGNPMGSRRHCFRPAPLPAVAADTEIELAVALVAPKRLRDFTAKFRVHGPDGRPFGDYVWVTITVSAKQAARDDLQCSFIADITVPDGTTMAPLQRFEKKWQVKTGDNPWPAGCVLKHVGGHPMGSRRHRFRPVPLPAVAAGTEIELAVALVAPKRSRDFTTKFRMHGPDGRPFGDYVWLTITVAHGGGSKEQVLHPGVSCDGSGEYPLRGIRYHKIGVNYDLNQTEFFKLSPEQKLAYEAIEYPGAMPMRIWTQADKAAASAATPLPPPAYHVCAEHPFAQLDSATLEMDATPAIAEPASATAEAPECAADPPAEPAVTVTPECKDSGVPPPFEEAMRTLKNMGFMMDTAEMYALLESVAGDIGQAVAALLQQQTNL